MTGMSSKDPAELWREMLGQWEKGVNAMATQFMGTDEFSREMNRVLGASLRIQKTSQELLGRYFDALNLPTKDDIRALGERLQAMEEQLGRVADTVERMAGDSHRSASATPSVPRTKRFKDSKEAAS